MSLELTAPFSFFSPHLLFYRIRNNQNAIILECCTICEYILNMMHFPPHLKYFRVLQIDSFSLPDQCLNFGLVGMEFNRFQSFPKTIYDI